ncbi:MAG: hypothetical protein ACP5UN_03680 [Candidatus Micrarchaeia archaeon]
MKSFILLLFILLIGISFASSLGSLTIVSNTVYQNTNSSPLYIYTTTSSSLKGWMGSSTTNLQLVMNDQATNEITLQYNDTSLLVVPPEWYYKFNFTNGTFYGEYITTQPSNIIMFNTINYKVNNMIAIFFGLFALTLLILRLVKINERKNMYGIILILSALMMFIAYYFAVFAPITQSTMTTNVLSCSNGACTTQTQQLNTTLVSTTEHIPVQSNGFILLTTFVGFYIIILFILIIRDFAPVGNVPGLNRD